MNMGGAEKGKKVLKKTGKIPFVSEANEHLATGSSCRPNKYAACGTANCSEIC